LSAPAHPDIWFQCALPQVRLLGKDGDLVNAVDLRSGQQLLGLKKESGIYGTIISLPVTLKSVWQLPARLRDVVTVGSGQLTACHELLACTTCHKDKGGQSGAWGIFSASELIPGNQELLVAMTNQGRMHMARWKYAGSSCVQDCEVVEFQLQEEDCFVLLEVGHGVFAAILGCARMPEMQAVVQHGFVHVQSVSAEDFCSRTSASDPLHNAPSKDCKVLRTVRPPHDQTCQAKCRFHFSAQGCRSGKLCPRCHHEDHKHDHSPSHHGRRRRRCSHAS